MNIQESSQSRSMVEGASEGTGFSLPLVSVIIVNHNYGRFLNQGVESVLSQTYPNVECIVVDNASTDETPRVVAGLIARYPKIRVIWRPRNDGQSPASIEGLAASSGHYIIFMDADDALLPHAIDTHIYVHLSLRVLVGFTSGDMLQAVDNEIVVATGEESNRFIRSGRGRWKKIFRPYEHALDEAWPSMPSAPSLEKKIHFVWPLTTKWVWSPTTGICYRRDALRLFADNAALEHLPTGTDMYFARGIGALSGSVIIDTPVFVYRIHGSNVFSRQPQLNHFLTFEVGGSGDNLHKAKLALVDHLVAKAGRFCQNIWLRLHYAALLARLDCRDDNPALARWQRRSRAAAQLAQSYDSVAPALGPRLTKLLMLWCGVPPTIIREVSQPG